MKRLFIYLSELLENRVFNERQQCIGRLYDISMHLNNDIYPRAKGIVVARGLIRRQYAFIPMEHVAEIDRKIQLRQDVGNVKFVNHKLQLEFALRRDILDQQVVDVDNQKVVRVNDVHLLRVDNQIHLAHVDVGTRGLIRRLDWTPFVDGMVRFINKDSPYLTEEELIAWKHTQALTLGRTKNVLKMDVARQKLAMIPPTAIAEIMQDLDIFEKLSLFKSFDTETQKRIFTDLPLNEKEELIDQMEDREASNLIANIPADEATDLLMELPKQTTQKLMRLMGNETSKKLRKLLGFEKDSAGGLMTTEYLYLKKEAVVRDAIDLVKASTDFPGNIIYIYIVDDDQKYLGTTSLRRFINEDEDKELLETVFEKKVFVRTDDGMEEIALLLEQYKFSSIPVLDQDDVLQGVITSDDVLEELIALTWTKYKDQL